MNPPTIDGRQGHITMPALMQRRWWWWAFAQQLQALGYTEFCWVTTSEVLGDFIFTKSGGLVFSQGEGRLQQYFPLLPAPVLLGAQKLAKAGCRPYPAFGPDWQPRLVEDKVNLPDLGAEVRRCVRESGPLRCFHLPTCTSQHNL